jgi:LmbE family N-acetylglucosaminyl deacetylase
LSENLIFGERDRLLVFAPHPDDESIATAGLLQIARAGGASRRVVVVTDGDNNPWPQRWIEKRWRIDAAARARWGERRRAEARAACRILGIEEDAMQFLGLPDLGLTDLLMANDAQTQTLLASTLDRFDPTHIALPALSDRHPDHSALHVMLQLALAECSTKPRLLAFGVHGVGAATSPIELRLDDSFRETKARAIFAHTTQMRLSGRRFLAYARPIETFQNASIPARADDAHPLRARIEQGQLEIRIDQKIWGGVAKGSLRVILDAEANSFFTQFELPRRDEMSQPDLRIVRLPLPPLGAIRQGFVKLGRREPGLRIFDRFGWQALETELK